MLLPRRELEEWRDVSTWYFWNLGCSILQTEPTTICFLWDSFNWSFVGTKVWIHFVGMYLELITFDFQKRYWNLYQQPSLPLFFELIRNWFILHITRMITYVYEFYVEDIFFLHWRDHFTRYFEAIWVPNTYVFKMKEAGKFDNPDQRIHMDVANFVTQTYSLTFGVMKMLLNLLMYSYMLLSITPTSMHPASLVGIAFLYSALGSMTMHLMGSKLAHFSWLGERCGGDFRSELRNLGNEAAVHGGMMHIFTVYHYIISIVGAKKFLDIMAS